MPFSFSIKSDNPSIAREFQGEYSTEREAEEAAFHELLGSTGAIGNYSATIRTSLHDKTRNEIVDNKVIFSVTKRIERR